MASESTKAKPVQGDKAGAVYVVGRTRYPVRKPGVWHMVGVYPTEKLAKAACYDKWCTYVYINIAADHDRLMNLFVTIEKGQVCFKNE